MREAAPTMQRVALLWDPSTGRGQLEVGQAVARAKGLQTAVIELGAGLDFDQVLSALGGRPLTGVISLTMPGFSVYQEKVAEATQRHRLPNIGFQTSYVRAGGLMSYGPAQDSYYPRAAVMADKIIRGAKPGDMPIEQPATFEFAINLKTARTLGLAIPKSLLLRADEVIEQ